MKTFDEIYEEIQELKKNELAIVFEKAKKENKKRNIIALIVCIIVDAIFIKLLLYPYISMMTANIGFGMIGIFHLLLPIIIVDFLIYIIVNGFYSKNRNKYKKMYKDVIINKMINNFYTELEYFPEKQMPEYIYEETDYNEYYNRYNSDDYFEAQLNNKYGVQMAEVITKKVERHRNSRGRTTTRTRLIFHGLFTKIVMDKSIKSKLKIIQDGELFFSDDKLKMDSSEFEKYFDVQASNQIIGMQLLTADVMEELIDFQNRTNIRYDICINNNNIYLRFHCGEMFEPKDIKTGGLDKQLLENYFYMLNFTYNLSNKLIKIINDIEI